MGNILTESNFSEQALINNKDLDGIFLKYEEEQLFGNEFASLLSVALCHGVINRYNDKKIIDKLKTRNIKLNDINKIFGSININAYKLMYVIILIYIILNIIYIDIHILLILDMK